MPEGDTIFRTATILRRAIGGRVVTGFDLVAAKVTPAASRRNVVGGMVKAVESNGKHLLITFSTDGEDVVLHTHMRMQGQWHVYKPGQRWWFAPSDARVVIRTAEYVAPCQTPPVVELMTAREVALHPVIPELGPDVIADDFDMDEAIRRLRAQPDRDVATAFLDQRTLSGIGNEIKNEALFLTRIWPWRKIADFTDDELRLVVAGARELLRKNRDGGPRRSRFVLDRRQLRWVQERRGRPCYVCGTPIDAGYHENEFRRSYYCSSCQKTPQPTTP